MLCLLSSVVYAVYLILSQRILTAIGAITMLRYTFSGAAVSAIIVTFITGFDAPVFSMPFHWTPFLILMFVLIFPTTISYMLLPVGLKYLKTTVVAIYGYLLPPLLWDKTVLAGRRRLPLFLSVSEFIW